METNYAGAALLNLPVAGDVDTTTDPGYVKLPGCEQPIKTADIIEILHTDEAAEVAQVITVTIPTIVAGTRYGIRAGNHSTRMEISSLGIRTHGGTLGTLTGTAGNDKIKIGEMIGRSLRELGYNAVEAGMRVVLTHGATTAAGGFTLGETIVGATSGTRAIIRVAHATTPTVDIQEGIWTGTETLTGLTSGRTAAYASHAAGSTLVIIDKSGYFPGVGNRGGALNVYAGPNIAASAIAVTTAAVYGQGVGAELLAMYPRFDTTTGGIATGLLMFPTNELAISGELYKRADVMFRKDVSISAMDVGDVGATFGYTVWYDADAAGAAAFKAALDALV